jgi:predicted Zn finger-like uncharacterized protein
MRLICPNCDAQYEVPAEVMPPEGRDVQCSNCGRTWFQEHPDHASEAPTTTDDPALEDEEVVTVSETQDNAWTEPATDAEPQQETPEEPEDPEMPDGPARRELDPAVADVLRAEAELEAQARRNEAVAMESQPDLGLPEISEEEVRRAREAKERMAKMRGEYLSEDEEAQEKMLAASTAVMGSRRDLLPDIEEINSTLRANNDRSPEHDPGQTAQIEEQEKRGSRLGFSLTVAFVALLVLIYVFAPAIAQTLPPAAGMLETYVSMVDGWRAWLDTQMSGLLQWLDKTADGGS